MPLILLLVLKKYILILLLILKKHILELKTLLNIFYFDNI